ncbi:MAG: FAD-dependent oxidoreductase, partial [Lachnospiraceae bacterium]|nr:FAD-dependent oxidoreductase [Lachnospiraceae bacterium]
FEDYEKGVTVTEDDISADVAAAVKGTVSPANLRGIFSEDIEDAIIESMHKFGYTRKGFDTDAVMLGVETRTSSPVRIERDENFESNIKGLYPCGEGAGYAGGIVSAASDGLKCAEKIITRYKSEVC